MSTLNIRIAMVAACLSLASPGTQACASCGCTLNADAAMGYAAEAGWRASLQFDYIPQEQLRSGTHAVRGVPDGVEREQDTISRSVTAGLDFSADGAWSVGLRVPWMVRTHATYGESDSSQPLPELSHSASSSLGDVRLLGTFQGLLPAHNLGMQLGLKLPTGRFGESVAFKDGPLAGEPLDASLQPGTGSTDLIVGLYYFRAVGETIDVFADAQFQSAIKSRQDQPGNEYRPGNSTTVRLGLRYVANPHVFPQLQVNLLHKLVDQGALADVYSTAGYVAFMSPGVSLRLGRPLQLFGFAQVPVYSDLVGYQLFPRYTLSAGASYAF